MIFRTTSELTDHQYLGIRRRLQFMESQFVQLTLLLEQHFPMMGSFLPGFKDILNAVDNEMDKDESFAYINGNGPRALLIRQLIDVIPDKAHMETYINIGIPKLIEPDQGQLKMFRDYLDMTLKQLPVNARLEQSSWLYNTTPEQLGEYVFNQPDPLLENGVYFDPRSLKTGFYRSKLNMSHNSSPDKQWVVVINFHNYVICVSRNGTALTYIYVDIEKVWVRIEGIHLVKPLFRKSVFDPYTDLIHEYQWLLDKVKINKHPRVNERTLGTMIIELLKEVKITPIDSTTYRNSTRNKNTSDHQLPFYGNIETPRFITVSELQAGVTYYAYLNKHKLYEIRHIFSSDIEISDSFSLIIDGRVVDVDNTPISIMESIELAFKDSIALNNEHYQELLPPES